MNTAHVHLLLNHVPVVGTLLGLLILVIGAWRKSEEIKKAALIVFGVIALAAIPAYLSGDPAEDAVKGIPGVSKAIIESHESAAAVSFTGVVILGAVGLAGLFLYRRDKSIPSWFASSTLIGALVVCGLMAWTANLGGQIRHTEIRGGDSTSIPATSPPGHH